jgi:hypothetical protein
MEINNWDIHVQQKYVYLIFVFMLIHFDVSVWSLDESYLFVCAFPSPFCDVVWFSCECVPKFSVIQVCYGPGALSAHDFLNFCCWRTLLWLAAELWLGSNGTYNVSSVGNSHMAVLLRATGPPLFWPVRGQAAPTPHALARCGKRPFGAPLDPSSSLVRRGWLQLTSGDSHRQGNPAKATQSHSCSHSKQLLGLQGIPPKLHGLTAVATASSCSDFTVTQQTLHHLQWDSIVSS